MRWGKAKEQPASTEAGWFVTGEPLAGTEAAVDAIERGANSGVAALAAVDPAFNAGAFVAWSKTVYARAIGAWRTRNPEPLRPVMTATVWDDYARHLLMVSTLPLVPALMAAASGTPTLAGASADRGYQSVIIGFDVTTDPSVYAAWKLPVEQPSWRERWLFQRPGSCRTYDSGAVAVCPICGAPAEPEETGSCRYCHADVTTRTAGWLVTRTETSLARMAKMDERLAQLRSKMNARVPMPPPPVVAPPLQPPRAGPIS
jgi:hypothetical protein